MARPKSSTPKIKTPRKKKTREELVAQAIVASVAPVDEPTRVFRDTTSLALKDKTFLKPRNKPNIHIIGAGGIGGNLVYNLYRDRAALYQNYNKIYLYDGDEVEMKNLMRQNFANEDVGKNKATVIAERYRNYLDIVAIPSFFNPKFTSDNIRQIDIISSNDIIISCVDNIKTRLDILDELVCIFHELTNNEVPLFIDAGNETYHGSVVFAHNIDIATAYHDHLASRAPKKSDAPYDKSCADYAPQDEGFVQIYTVNMMAAMYASTILSNYIKQSLASNMKVPDKGPSPWTSYQKYATHGVMFTMTTTRNLNAVEDFQIQENTTDEKTQPAPQQA